MSRLDELINELCPNGVEFKCLGDIGQVKMCKRILKSQTNTNGGIPFYKIGTFGVEANAFISEELFQEYREKYSYPKVGEILISAAGTIGRTVVYDGEPAYYQDSNIVWLAHDESNILNTFLRYCYELKPWNISSGGTIARLYNDNILKAKVPVPPLEVQREIVHILDSFTLLTAELTAELTARKKQYEFYRDKVLSHDGIYPMKPLAELGKWSGGKTPSMSEKSFWDQGTIPWISSKDMKSSTLEDTQDHITEKAVKEASMTVYPANSIAVVTRSGILKHTFPVAYVPFETTINQDIKMLVVNENILPRYAFHVLQGKGNDILVKTKKQGGTVDSLDFQKVLTYKVPVPSKDVQSKLVEVLDNFESICTDLNIGLPAEIEARQKQYEYYRDLLLTFAETSSTLMTDRQTDRQTDRAERN